MSDPSDGGHQAELAEPKFPQVLHQFPLEHVAAVVVLVLQAEWCSNFAPTKSMVPAQKVRSKQCKAGGSALWEKTSAKKKVITTCVTAASTMIAVLKGVASSTLSGPLSSAHQQNEAK
eukprot:CAMPEP_0179145000 /NCGR_PEP_ID=MMETSP0796-20121207/69916_1 /TAXON_ID=73915 /ORGANISM="Pyrodinium bahamense, Strain pbaha01" /LENGTH=117 /DNA_ID=CAMNT_0020845321 /DNA_START=26 /DNA_END=377 /DNA_ORIENTATION=+